MLERFVESARVRSWGFAAGITAIVLAPIAVILVCMATPTERPARMEPRMSMTVQSPLITDNLIVNQLTTSSTYAVQNWQQDGNVCFGAPNCPMNNWNPAGLASGPVQVYGGDNWGSLVTGLDAIDNNFKPGQIITICNEYQPSGPSADDGSIMFSNEDTASFPGNRFRMVGNSTLPSVEDRYKLGPAACAQFVYINTTPGTVTPCTNSNLNTCTYRWFVLGSVGRQYRMEVSSLQLWPVSAPAPITGGTTIGSNWSPVDVCPEVGGSAGSSCQDGYSTTLDDISMIEVSETTSSTVTLQSMEFATNGSPAGLGPMKCIENNGPANFVIQHEGTGSAGNLFSFPNAAAMTIQPGGMECFWNDQSFWHPIGSVISFASNVSPTQLVMGSGSSQLSGAAGSDNGAALIWGPMTLADSVTQTALAAMTLNPTGTGLASTSNIDARILDSRTFDTTGGATTVVGIVSALTSSQSAGANGVTNEAINIAASGGQNNYALVSQGGNVYWGLGGAMSFYFVNSAEWDDSGIANITGNLSVGSSAFGGALTTEIKATTGHILAVAGGTPVLSSCGTGSPTVTGTDAAGHYTTGGTATTCTLTFATTYTNTPNCIVTAQGTATEPTYTVSATAITVTVDIANTTYSYICIGAPAST
jgi:hypothetical protein